MGNVLGKELVEIYEAFKKNDLATAQALQKRLVEPNKCISKLFGVPALKFILDAYGYYGGPCRKPLLELKPAEKEQVKAAFRNNGFKWSD